MKRRGVVAQKDGKPKAKRRANRVKLTYRPPQQRRQGLLVPKEATPTRLPLVDFGLSNTAILRQLAMIERVMFALPPAARDKAVDVLLKAMEFPDVEIQIKGATGIARLAAVNASVLKSLASDQFQRHLTFGAQEEEAAKDMALDQMTDEELAALESLSRKAGGHLEVSDARQH